MKVLTLISLVMLSMSSNVFGIWPFGSLTNDMKILKDSTEKKFSDINAELGVIKDVSLQVSPELGVIKDNQTELRDNQFKLSSELGVIKGNQIELRAAVNAFMSANVTAQAGVGNTATTASAGRDITDNHAVTNDSDLLWKIIYGLLSLIGVLVGNQFWVVKRLFTEMSSARFYQNQLAIKSEDNTEFEKVMQLKKDIEKRKSITHKLVSTFKTIKK